MNCIGYTKKKAFSILVHKMYIVHKMKVLSISDEDEQRPHLKVLLSLWKMFGTHLKNNQKLLEHFM